MLQALGHRLLAPGRVQRLGALAATVAVVLGDGQQALGGVGAAVQDHVLDRLAQFRRDVLVNRDLPGVDDPHVHARGDGVVEEDRVHGLAHRVVAAEGEGDVGDAARDVGVGQAGADHLCRRDEGAGVVVVLGDAGGDCEDVGIEDDVLGRQADLFGQQAVGALADRELALRRFRLALLVEGHDHHGGAVAPDQAGLLQELGLALLEADGVHHRLALDAAQAGLDDGPLGGVDHHRDSADLRLASQEVEEAGHGRLGVQHGLVHVDVDDLGAVLDLLAGDQQAGLVVAFQDQAPELRRAGDVGALPDVDEAPLQVLRRAHWTSAKASRPESRSRGGRCGTSRGGSPATASAMAAMCSGLEPQQPPTRLTRPSRAQAPI